MPDRREFRKSLGPSVSLSFSAPPSETKVFEEAAKKEGVSRAAFFYYAVKKEAERILKKKVAA